VITKRLQNWARRTIREWRKCKGREAATRPRDERCPLAPSPIKTRDNGFEDRRGATGHTHACLEFPWTFGWANRRMEVALWEGLARMPLGFAFGLAF